MTTEITPQSLSRREWQVVQKIMQGLPNKLIADQLFITERTVKFHCANIYRKLNIPNRSCLITRMFKAMPGAL
ncbi:LuxR family transcriptional regulator [Aestuariibacter salexigens]|uniref:LuxR family transcriptional regulator n=1 Tax=Aestuariibacter salexigens TaxID=226010 RepID=UPI00041E55D4|nr:LuxR family transcriptional regulator [Aestuariibacter salexigens]